MLTLFTKITPWSLNSTSLFVKKIHVCRRDFTPLNQIRIGYKSYIYVHIYTEYMNTVF